MQVIHYGLSVFNKEHFARFSKYVGYEITGVFFHLRKEINVLPGEHALLEVQPTCILLLYASELKEEW